MRVAPRCIAAVVLCAWMAWPAWAAADEKLACIAASDDGQRLRDDGKLVEARAKMVLCANSGCPAILRAECGRWLSDLDASVPTVTLSARDTQGNDLAAVEVLLDGVPFTSNLDGKAVAIDPGPHLLRFEAMGKSVAEERLIVREGERNRIVAVVLQSADGAVARPAPPRSQPLGSLSPATTSYVERDAGYIVAGFGLAGFGVASGLWITGTAQLNALRNGCGQTHGCSTAEVNSVRDQLRVADVTAAPSVIAVGVGLYLLVAGSLKRAQTSAGPSPTLSFLGLPGGGLATLKGSF